MDKQKKDGALDSASLQHHFTKWFGSKTAGQLDKYKKPE